MKNSCGIYKIVNNVNKKIYVGSSINLNKRKMEHFNKLKLNKHENSYLQRSFNKYGEKNFTFKIIEYVEFEINLLNREQFWINKLNVCDDMYGYNLCPNAGNSLGRKTSNATKDKLRQISLINKYVPPSFLGKHHSKETREKMSRLKKDIVPINAVNARKRKVINVDTQEVFESATEASIIYNIVRSGITKVCLEQQNTSGGYKWAYLKDYNEEQ
jgi:group I intron endonuclease